MFKTGLSSFCPLPGPNLAGLLKGIPPNLPAHLAAHLPAPLPHLGRLVPDGPTMLPFPFSGTPLPPRPGPRSVHQQVLGQSGLLFFRPPVQTEPDEPLQSVPDPTWPFRSPSAEKTSSSSSPDKRSPEFTHTFSFTQEDLFSVLYGYSRTQTHPESGKPEPSTRFSAQDPYA